MKDSKIKNMNEPKMAKYSALVFIVSLNFFANLMLSQYLSFYQKSSFSSLEQPLKGRHLPSPTSKRDMIRHTGTNALWREPGP
jgi:hypothetical protein